MTFEDFDIRPFVLGAAVAIALEVGAAALTGSLASHTSASPTSTTPTTFAATTSTTVRGPALTQPPIQTPTTRAPSPAVASSAPSPAAPPPACAPMVAALPPPAASDVQAQDTTADMQTCTEDPVAFQACLGLDIRAKQAPDAIKQDANNQWVSCEQSHGVAKSPYFGND